ncbi:Serine acetyltransferase [BD1-7 clade bacterium]|uniref:Serine acetyltransferase n=1 Tax=BD1-7 clade bacterium TaxID=2029982 RepID=A0A5S9Q9J2_9GAMM|nr:Serine acetyltransferase [BD1-7 clade bacterium]
MTHPIWQTILDEARDVAECEPLLVRFLDELILAHEDLEHALTNLLAAKLNCEATSLIEIRLIVEQALQADPTIIESAYNDLKAVVERDSACDRYSLPLLYFKGYQALQAYRISHWLWSHGRQSLAQYFQHRISVVFAVDIHPGAKLGHGIMIDHATGVVIGETCVIGNNVSIMQSVTLGGTGKEQGDRHPKVGDGVLISSGAKILGNIHLGEGCKVGAGSVVLKDVPAHMTVAGVPAKVVGRPNTEQPALNMNHSLNGD